MESNHRKLNQRKNKPKIKKPRTAFNFYVSENYDKVIEEVSSLPELFKELGKRYRQLSDHEKIIYYRKEREDKDRWMEDYLSTFDSNPIRITPKAKKSRPHPYEFRSKSKTKKGKLSYPVNPKKLRIGLESVAKTNESTVVKEYKEDDKEDAKEEEIDSDSGIEESQSKDKNDN